MHERSLWCSTRVTRDGFFWNTQRFIELSIGNISRYAPQSVDTIDTIVSETKKTKKHKKNKTKQPKAPKSHYFSTPPFVNNSSPILEEYWNTFFLLFFWFFGFGVIGVFGVFGFVFFGIRGFGFLGSGCFWFWKGKGKGVVVLFTAFSDSNVPRRKCR